MTDVYKQIHKLMYIRLLKYHYSSHYVHVDIKYIYNTGCLDIGQLCFIELCWLSLQLLEAATVVRCWLE